jgi:hypothetical protein
MRSPFLRSRRRVFIDFQNIGQKPLLARFSRNLGARALGGGQNGHVVPDSLFESEKVCNALTKLKLVSYEAWPTNPDDGGTLDPIEWTHRFSPQANAWLHAIREFDACGFEGRLNPTKHFGSARDGILSPSFHVPDCVDVHPGAVGDPLLVDFSEPACGAKLVPCDKHLGITHNFMLTATTIRAMGLART